MISKKDITKFAKNILKRQKGLRDHQMIHPQREWFTGLAIGVILFVSGVVWSTMTYFDVSERDVNNINTEEVEQTVYRVDIVKSALDDFRDRKAKYDDLLENKITIEPEQPIVEPEIETEQVPNSEIEEPDEEDVQPTTTDNTTIDVDFN